MGGLLERRGIAVLSIHAEHGFSPFSATEFGANTSCKSGDNNMHVMEAIIIDK